MVNSEVTGKRRHTKYHDDDRLRQRRRQRETETE